MYKRNFLTPLFLVLAALVVSACASVPMSTLAEDQEGKEFKVPAGKSRLYIYRDETLGGAIKVPVAVDGKPIGDTAPNSYFVVDLAPGKHNVTCTASSNGKVTVTTKKNEPTFVWQEMKMGLMVAGCAVHEVTAPIGQKGVQSCKRAQTN